MSRSEVQRASDQQMKQTAVSSPCAGRLPAMISAPAMMDVRATARVPRPGTRLRGPLGFLALAVVVLTAPWTGSAHAADAKTEVADLTTAIRDHKKAKDVGQLKADLDVAVRLHASLGDDDAMKKKVIAQMVSIGKGSKNTDLTKQMIIALGATKDPAAASTVKGYLRQKNKKKSDDILLTAIKVAGSAPQSAYVEPLLKLFEKSKHLGISAKALDSLGAYHQVKNKRAKIAKVVLEHVRKYKPGAKGNQKGMLPGEEATQTGEGARSRWQTLSPIVPKMMGRLTGNEMYGAKIDDWFTMYDENKRDLKELFTDE